MENNDCDDSPVETEAEEAEVETVECADCEKTIPASDADTFTVNGSEEKILCPECAEKYFECHECDELVHEEDGRWVGDRFVCDDCFDECYVVCENCDESIHLDDSYRTGDGHTICERCRRNDYFCCDACGELARDDESLRTDSGSIICQGCYEDHYFTCGHCGEIFYEDDANSTEDGDCYCSSCYEEEVESGIIRNHSDKAANYLHPFGNGPIFYGVELECECCEGSRNDKAVEVLGRIGQDFAVCKEDGSLHDGFEIVTARSDLAEHRKRWEQCLGSRIRGLKSWDTTTCGMHVHVSRRPLTQLAIGKILVFMNSLENADFIKSVAGRGSNTYSRIDPHKKVTDAKDSYDRYVAVNLTNTATIEFRVFKGTLLWTSVLKNLEFVAAVVEFCSREAGMQDLGYWSFLAWVGKTPKVWPFLTAWLRTRGFLPKPKPKPEMQLTFPVIEAQQQQQAEV